MTRSRTSSHGEVRQLPLAAGAVAGVAAYGEAELVLPLPAAMAVKRSALFPGVGADLMGLVVRGVDPDAAGRDGSRWAPSALTGSATTSRAEP